MYLVEYDILGFCLLKSTPTQFVESCGDLPLGTLAFKRGSSPSGPLPRLKFHIGIVFIRQKVILGLWRYYLVLYHRPKLLAQIYMILGS